MRAERGGDNTCLDRVLIRAPTDGDDRFNYNASKSSPGLWTHQGRNIRRPYVLTRRSTSSGGCLSMAHSRRACTSQTQGTRLDERYTSLGTGDETRYRIPSWLTTFHADRTSLLGRSEGFATCEIFLGQWPFSLFLSLSLCLSLSLSLSFLRTI